MSAQIGYNLAKKETAAWNERQVRSSKGSDGKK